MIGELNNVKLRGLSFEEYQGDIIKAVRYFIRHYYPQNPALRFNGYDEEDVEMAVYQKLYNRKDSNSLSNIEKYFIKASAMADGAYTYISCTIRKAVVTCLMDIQKSFRTKKHIDYILFSNYEKLLPSGDLDDVLGDGYRFEFDINKRSDLGRDSISYFELLESLPLIEYEKYYTYMGKNKVTLNSRILLDLIVEGNGRSELGRLIYLVKNDRNIGLHTLDSLKAEVIDLAKCTYKDYLYGGLSYNSIRR